MKLNIFSWTVAVLSALILTVACCYGAEVPQLRSHVNDYAHVLSDSDRAALDHRLSDFEHNTKSNPQVVILTVQSLGDESIEEYSNNVFHTWKLGHTNNNNGVLSVFSVQDHKMRIEVGYDLEPTLTDSKSQSILDSLKPSLRAGNWNKALNDETNQILPIVSTAVTGDDAVVTDNSTKHSTSSGGHYMLGFLLFVIIVGAIIYFVARGINRANRFDPPVSPNRPLHTTLDDNTTYTQYTPPRPSYTPYTPPYNPPPAPEPKKSSAVESAVVGGLAGAAASEFLGGSSRRRDDDDSYSRSSSSDYSSSSSDSSSSSSSFGSDSGFSGGGGDSGGGGASSGW